MCAKLSARGQGAARINRIGGSTFSFDVWPGHPYADRVLSLLERTRAELSQLWDELHAHNQRTARPPEYDRVTFYFGQNLTSEGELDSGSKA